MMAFEVRRVRLTSAETATRSRRTPFKQLRLCLGQQSDYAQLTQVSRIFGRHTCKSLTSLSWISAKRILGHFILSPWGTATVRRCHRKLTRAAAAMRACSLVGSTSWRWLHTLPSAVRVAIVRRTQVRTGLRIVTARMGECRARAGGSAGHGPDGRPARSATDALPLARVGGVRGQAQFVLEGPKRRLDVHQAAVVGAHSISWDHRGFFPNCIDIGFAER